MSKAIIGVTVCGVSAALFAWSMTAAAATRWESKCFNTFDGMVSGLNSLQASAVHLVTVPSSRNVLGWAGEPYCVVYAK